MDRKLLLAAGMAAIALEQAEEEIKQLRNIIAILAFKNGGSISFTSEDVDAYFELPRSTRQRKEGDVFSFHVLNGDEVCTCQLCQNAELTRAQSPSKERH